MATTSNSISVRIITHNIRTIPLLRFPPEKSWDIRRHHIIRQLTTHTRHHPEALICLQEVLCRQLDDILTGLNSNTKDTNLSSSTREDRNDTWKHIGCGRDGNTKGEHSPILFRSDVWDMEWTETNWLCPNSNDRPSRGWDAAYRRILTAAVLRHRASNRRVLASNTHLDHRGRRSRFEGAKLVLHWMQEWLSNSGLGSGVPLEMGFIKGVFLCGDFNTDAHDERDAYGVLTGNGAIFADSRHLLIEDRGQTTCGDGCSFTGFNDNPKDDLLLDYVLLGPKGNGPWEVQVYDILPNKADNGVYISDHRAIVVDTELKGT